MSKRQSASGIARIKSSNVAFGEQKEFAAELDEDSEAEEEDRSAWLEFSDPEAKRRVAELEMVSGLLDKMHFNDESGLVSVIGPTLGFLDTDFVLSRDGDILGRASKVAPLPHSEDVRVVEVCKEMQGKIGLPDFPVVQYGITSPGGEVLAAELVGETLKVMCYPEKENEKPPQPHPLAGQQVVIGRVALRQLSRVQTSRILVMGGKSASRDELLRWFADVREFEYERELKRLRREIRVSRRNLDDRATTDGTVRFGSAKDGGGSRATEDSPHGQLEREAQASFKLIATLADDALEAELAGLERRLAQAVRRDDELNGGADGDADRASVAGSSSAKSVGGKTESSDEPEADAHAAARLRQDLEHQVARFRHVQGSKAPISKVIDPNGSMGEEWSSVRGEGAMQLLYNGVRARSQLMQVGSEKDFMRLFATKAATGMRPDSIKSSEERRGAARGSADMLRLVRGEVLLSVPGRQGGERRPPGSLIFINGPDIPRNCASSSAGEADIVEILRPRLLVANLQAGDDDASGRVEFGEFAKAFEALALEPPIPRGEVAQLWAILDADGGGSVEARDVVELFSEDQGAQAEGFETAINVEEAYAVMADIADVIIVLLDGKLSRFNPSELKIVQREILGRTCTPPTSSAAPAMTEWNQDLLALGLAVSELLSDRSLENLAAVSPTSSDGVTFVNALINPQKQQATSLVAGFKRNLDSILLRAGTLFAEFAAAANDDVSPVLMDAAALAACVDSVARGCERAARRVPKSGGTLLQDLKAAARASCRAARELLRRSRVRPLTLAEREELRSKDTAAEEAATRAVAEEQVGEWATFRHVRLWLRQIGASPETEENFRAAGVSPLVDQLHKLLRVDAERLRRWRVPVGDRLRVTVAVKRLREERARRGVPPDTTSLRRKPEPGECARQVVRARRAAFLAEGLFALLPGEAPNGSPLQIALSRDALADQGPGQPDKRGGLREGSEVLLDAPTHGRIRVRVPPRAALEASGWVMEAERRKGGRAYIGAEDMAVMSGVLHGEVACAASSRELLQDGLQLLLTGDIPPQLMAEAVADLRAEMGEDLAEPSATSWSPEGERGKCEGGEAEVYARRWKLESAYKEQEPPSSEDEQEEDGLGEGVPWQERLPAVLQEVWAHVAGSDGVVADGPELEAALFKSRSFRAVLKEAGAELAPGGAGGSQGDALSALASDVLLRREFVESVVGALDPAARAAARQRPV